MIFVSLQFEGTPALKGGLSFDLKKKVKNPKYFCCLGYYIEKNSKKKNSSFRFFILEYKSVRVSERNTQTHARRREQKRFEEKTNNEKKTTTTKEDTT